MFSSSVAGGSICLGCQLRAVTQRAAPIASTAAHNRIRNRRRRRYYASRATRRQEGDAFSALETESHNQATNLSHDHRRRAPTDNWGLSESLTDTNNSGQSEQVRHDDFVQQAIEGQLGPDNSFDGQASSTQQGTGPVWVAPGGDIGVVRRKAIGVTWEEHRIRAFWKGDTKLVQDFRPLAIDTLGKSADIIVLREEGKYKKKKPPKVHESSKDDKDLKDFVDQDPNLGLDTVMDNIEELRPQHRILPAREFKVIFDMLMKSFTSAQLTEYVTRYHERLEQDNEPHFSETPPDSGTNRPWIVSEIRWIPDVQGAVPDVDPSLQGYILKTMPVKQRRAMQVMRECWGMSVQELTHGLGTLEVKVRDLEFKLLTIGNQRWLQQLTRIYLSQGKGKSISIVKSRNVLRIEAPKAIAESCLDAFDRMLQKIRTKTFNMDRTNFANLDAGVVEELGQLTNSVVAMDNTSNEISVSWIDYQDRAISKLEDLGDTVFRLLLTGNPPSNIEHSLHIYPRPLGKARLVEDLTSNKKMPWMHRRMRWARLCLPASTPSTLLEESWSSNDGALKYDIVPLAQDFVIPISNFDAKTYAFRATKWGRVGDIVASRTGREASPLAPPRLRPVSRGGLGGEEPENQSSQPWEEPHTSSELETWERGQTEAQENVVTEEDHSSLKSKTSPEEQPDSQKPSAPENSLVPDAMAKDKLEIQAEGAEEIQTSSKPKALGEEEEEEHAAKPQMSENPQAIEELEKSSEPEMTGVERAKLSETQTPDEFEVPEQRQTTVDSEATADEQLTNDEPTAEDCLEEQQVPVSATLGSPPRWSPFRVRTNALFGHVLHLFQPDWAHSADKAIDTTLDPQEIPRTISPLIPPLTKMDLKGWVPYNFPSDMESMVLLRFVPSEDDIPSSSQRPTNPAPLLELRLKASDEEIIEIDSLRAIARTHVSDLLFPTEPVDVRTTQRLESELPASAINAVDGIKPLLTFLMDSHLQIKEGTLVTPPRIKELGLPQWMFQDHHHEFFSNNKSLAGSESTESSSQSMEEQAESSKTAGEEDSTSLRPVSYVFAGLEVHRTIETAYDGWKLVYTSIEAGQGGGRRAELSLEAKPAYDTDLRRTEEQINSQEFLQSVYTLVRGLPGKLIRTRKPEGHKVRTTIEWLGAGKKGL